MTPMGFRSYVAKTTEQLEHALGAMEARGVELRADKVVGDGPEGRASSQREVQRVREEVSLCSSLFYKERGGTLGETKEVWDIGVFPSTGIFARWRRKIMTITENLAVQKKRLV